MNRAGILRRSRIFGRPGILGPIRLSHSNSTASPLVLQLWGANTGVGKTVLAAGLIRTVDRPSLYLKPVQSGYPEDDDVAVVQRNAHCAHGIVLNKLGPPVSPDLAAKLEKVQPIDDDVLRSQTASTLGQFIGSWEEADSPSSRILALVETAGGVLSPAPSGTLQADVYRQLRLPALLLGDSRLGGITTTLAAFEALHLRGYDVPAVVFFGLNGSELDNEASVDRHVKKYGTSVFQAPPLPPEDIPLAEYFGDAKTEHFFSNLHEHLQYANSKRFSELKHMQTESRNVFWYPFTQHRTLDKVTCVDSASGDNFTCYDPEMGLHEVVDGAGSWWTNGVGHGNAEVSKAMAHACGRYGHVMFPEATNEPAFKLANLLLQGPGDGWADRVFYSDNGSTAVEVALKMAFRKRAIDFPGHQGKPVLIVGIEGCYHGDTLGVMDCAPMNDYNRTQTPWYKSRGIFFEPPIAAVANGTWHIQTPTEIAGEVEDLEIDETSLFDKSRSVPQYDAHISARLDEALGSGAELGALLIEPVVMGAGGMQLVDPAFHRALVEQCRSRSIPIIFDEIFTGLWRLGTESAAEILGVTPDIAAYGKLLTGGTVPLSATLATSEVFASFDGESKVNALLHGHSYTAHPIGCAAGVESLRQYSEMSKGRVYWDKGLAQEISCMDDVASVTSIGTVLAVRMESQEQGYAATGAKAVVEALDDVGVFARPLGNVVYILCTPLSSPEACKSMMDRLYKALLMRSNAGQRSASA